MINPSSFVRSMGVTTLVQSEHAETLCVPAVGGQCHSESEALGAAFRAPAGRNGGGETGSVSVRALARASAQVGGGTAAKVVLRVRSGPWVG